LLKGKQIGFLDFFTIPEGIIDFYIEEIFKKKIITQ